MTTLAELRAKLKAKEERNSGNNGGGDRAVFAHWNQPEGSTSKIRFLWDGNPNNSFFWAEKQTIRLPFVGIKGQFDSKATYVQVPCMEMYGTNETCPILAEIRPWFKGGEEEVALAKKYWKKRQYIFQGFVRETQYKEDSVPENPIRKFLIGQQLYNPIKQALMDSEIEELPTNPERGLDFNIIKTSKGGYADYSTSNWARRESALTSAELAAIDTYGVPDLSDYLPKKPTPADLEIIMEMFEASVDGQPYDPDRWAAFYKPPGLNADDNSQSSGSNTSSHSSHSSQATGGYSNHAEVDEDDEIPVIAQQPVQSVQTNSGNKKAEDILAMIRNRQAQK